MSSNKTEVVKDFSAKTILVTREFAAPVINVWRAFTEAALLDQWWGPSPWRAETKHMDFSVGGHWLYAMVSPEGQKHWGRMNYIAIQKHEKYQFQDAFCDQNGELNPELPLGNGTTSFIPTATGTRVEMMSYHPTEADMQAIIEMGFEEGITQCFEQLATLIPTVKA
jgi:uncharacterized protein YndB with AHSA1/START domain